MTNRANGRWLGTYADSGDGNGKAKLAALKEAVRAAWRTAAVLPDIDARFRKGLGVAWPFSVVMDVKESYGYHPTWLKTVASPNDIAAMEIVMEWMVWLRQQPNGDVALKRIIGWSLSVPLHILAARERRSERTIMNRIDRSLSDILREFEAIELDVEVIDEREVPVGGIRSFGEPRGKLESGDLPDAGKVYIAGVGFLFRGRKYRSSYDAAKEYCGKSSRKADLHS